MSGLQFLVPLGLLALIGIPLVILLHMRHTTPVERTVPTLRFWRQVAPAPTDDARWRKPPLTLLLILQLVAVGALGLALARPAVADALAGLTQRTEPRHLVLVLDGSTSMSAIDGAAGADRFETAKAIAGDRVDALHDGDVATVLVLGTSVQSFEATDSAGLRVLRERLEGLALPGGRADLNAALSLVANLLLPELDSRVVVITDGAVAADPSVVGGVAAPIELVQVGRASEANLAVVELTAQASGAGAALFARLANFSDEHTTVTVSVLADGVPVDSQTVQIDANETIDFTSDLLPAGVSRLGVELRSEDVLPQDNRAELILARESDLAQRILLVSDTPLVLQRVLSALPGAQVTTISTADHLIGNTGDGPYDLLVFEAYTPENAGDVTAPAVFVRPPVDGLFPATGVTPIATVQHVRAGDPLLNGVDLTGISFVEVPTHTLAEGDIAIVDGENSPLIYGGTVPGGSEPMVVLAFDLQQSLLPQRIAFPILMTNVVRALAPAALPASAILGETVVIEPRTGAETIRV
ncbi:MAG: BatA domain-containing protein, partial [Thermomicrobiales bacterium]|nr:BatA domain-containing protein [Thermomicrobiales bacterium]